MKVTLTLQNWASRRATAGVALIVTLIMLSVITFLTVTFLVLSQRETGAVTTSTQQLLSKQAADSATDRAKVELLAPMLMLTNSELYDLVVSTNYINAIGFNDNLGSVGNPFTNVNFDYRIGGLALSGDHQRWVLTNLLYNPRAPVYMTNHYSGSNEFRFYLDLNRNGRYDPTGLVPEVSQGVTNYFWRVGDPEWIGVLERPEQPHSANNRFISRYAYLVVPAGKTLDVNHIHNQAFAPRSLVLNDDSFFRNQGVGTWEINLAAFFHDLNPNFPNGWGANYQYRRPGLFNIGLGFEDAFGILNYRYGGSYANLARAVDLFPAGPLGVNRFQSDGIDLYSDGPLTANALLEPPADPIAEPWVGADNPNHLFGIQEFFNPGKVSPGLSNRLFHLGRVQTNNFDRYTYYRMLAQLGTDGEPDRRMNLNYVNVDGAMRVIPGMETNLLSWSPLQFFTNAADRMIREQFPNSGLSITNIPVYVSNRLVYPPDVHRLLQVAANMYEATTNTLYPSMYQPYFEKIETGFTTNVYIRGYSLVYPVLGSSNFLSKMVDIHDVEELGQIPLSTNVYRNIYGVPWIVGARKGLPNINEISAQTFFSMTRKVEIEKPSITSTDRRNFQYRQQLVMDLSSALGVETWNSYRSNFPSARVRVDGFVAIGLTNNQGFRTNMVFQFGPLDTPGTGPWPGYGPGWPRQAPDPTSFRIPLRTNLMVVNGPYSPNSRTFLAPNSTVFEPIPTTPVIWGFTSTNHVRAMIYDDSGRVFDYVQLQGPVFNRDLSAEIQNEPRSGFYPLWGTNAMTLDVLLPEGIHNQLMISLGFLQSDGSQWRQFGLGPANNQSKDAEVALFKAFYLSQDQVTPVRAQRPDVTVMQMPFTPARTIVQTFSWQANDPLVHYIAEDLLDLIHFVPIQEINPPLNTVTTTNYLPNIGMLNERYDPWGGKPGKAAAGNPYAFDSGFKDPMVRGSDDWQFPTNKFPSIGWLGRVHRGTPWQTVYLKSRDVLRRAQTQQENQVRLRRWIEWTGNSNPQSATNTSPTTDRMLIDLFTAIPNPNAGIGRLSVNQENLAAWSAVLSGVPIITNGLTALIDPAAVAPQVGAIVDGINRTRGNTNILLGRVYPEHRFQNIGDVFATPELSDHSPFLSSTNFTFAEQLGLTDAVIERIPQQIASLLGLPQSPRFVVYSFGQSLRPAEQSVIRGFGPLQGICTNYQVTAESATRTVFRVEGSMDPRDRTNAVPLRRYPPRLVVEQFNMLPPD